MITTWSITNTKRVIATGAVTEVHWTCRVKHDVADEVSTESGISYFQPDVNAPGFVPYDKLTEEVIIGWVHAKPSVDAPSIVAGLTAKTNERVTRKNQVGEGVPWE